MTFINRIIQSKLSRTLSRGKSILLLGPRQTGKTTLLDSQVESDLTYSFIKPELRREFETNPEKLVSEIKAFIQLEKPDHKPVVLIDEVQKVPGIMDPVQDAIDQGLALFVLTGSSARKLKHNKEHIEINLLPGRVIELRMDALSILEIPNHLPELEDLLLNGSLPEVIQQTSQQDKEELLTSYVNIYLEEEIRVEAVVRNLASFSRFLTYAAVDAGSQANINKLSEEIGVARHTIYEYYQILLDCLVADRIEPITNVTTRRRLSKSPKYLFFDMGIRRIAAGEGLRLPEKYYGELFEQFIGIELLKLIRLYAPQAKLRYWHDHNGPEVDYVIEYNRQYLPIEVKYTTAPSKGDARHLLKFMNEYDCVKPAYVVCRTARPMALYDDVLAVGWGKLIELIRDFLSEP